VSDLSCSKLEGLGKGQEKLQITEGLARALYNFIAVGRFCTPSSKLQIAEFRPSAICPFLRRFCLFYKKLHFLMIFFPFSLSTPLLTSTP